MSTDKSRSQEELFTAMHGELRRWNSEIPESPDRLDPILRLMLQLYSSQLATIDRRLDHVWETASHSLIRALCPDSLRWPVPAFTVMRCEPRDPMVEVDTHTRFFYKEQHEGGQTFFFSSLRHEKILSAEVKHVFLKSGDDFVNISTSPSKSSMSDTQSSIALSADHSDQMYIAVDYDGPTLNFRDAVMFLKGSPDVLKQLQWATWYPGSNFGTFYEDCGFCPGLSSTMERIFKAGGKQMDWGGLRTSRDLFAPLANSFICLPENFADTWEIGPPAKDLSGYLERREADLASDKSRFYWIRIDLPRGGDKSLLRMPVGVYFNAFVVVNKNELTLFKHTGGYRLVEIEIPEDITNILEITRVVDSNGRDYFPRHEVADREHGSYTLEERDQRLVLWFDYGSEIGLPPDAITVNYNITSGVRANGIEAGRINELYENHPGLLSVENIVPVGGAMPSKTTEQIVSEVSARLRNRDRALGFREIANWALTFDPGIKKAVCVNGVERAARGVRRCVVVTATVEGQQFYSDEELDLLKFRLRSFLKARAPINTQFRIEIETV